MGSYRHGDVEAVHEADTVGGKVTLAVVEAELSQGSRRLTTEATALEAATAVSGGACELATRVDAASTGPNASGPVGGWGGDGAVGESGESKAATLEDRVSSVRLYGGPDSEGAVVDECEDESAAGVGCVQGGYRGDGEEKREEKGESHLKSK